MKRLVRLVDGLELVEEVVGNSLLAVCTAELMGDTLVDCSVEEVVGITARSSVAGVLVARVDDAVELTRTLVL